MTVSRGKALQADNVKFVRVRLGRQINKEPNEIFLNVTSTFYPYLVNIIVVYNEQ